MVVEELAWAKVAIAICTLARLWLRSAVAASVATDARCPRRVTSEVRASSNSAGARKRASLAAAVCAAVA